MTDTFEPTPLIIDDDGSQDGMTAIAYMLANPQFDVQAITISNGIARPEVFDDNLLRMLDRLGDLDIPVGVGQSSPLEGNNEFPDFIRDGSDTFWSPFVSLPEETPDVETQDAVDLIIETVKNFPEPVAILATGPLTNIAEALRRDPSIIENIEVVQIMGGAVFVEGNLPVLTDPPFSTNEVAEFNIWIDPVAAQEVFEAGERGLNIQLTPLDATNQIEFDREDYREWLDTGTPESEISAEFLDYAIAVIQSDNDPNPVWDLVAAINLAEPDFSEETPLHIDVDTESDPGDTQGQTFAVDDLPPNVNVSLNPSFDNLSFDAGETFSYLELPIVSLSADTNTIVEGGEAQLLTFHLSEPAPAGGLTVNLNIDDPDGEGADTEFPPELISNIVDFVQVEEDGTITASLTIAEGETVATFGISAIADGLNEENETYSLTLLPDETYIANPDSTTITTTIEDNMTSPTVSITPETLIATEGETFAWNFSLDTPAPAGGLSLFLPITVNNDPAPGDVEYNIDGSENIADFEFVTNNDLSVGFNLTIAEGATEATLVSEAIADDITETDESFTTVIADGVDYKASEQNEVTTIITELPVVSLVTSEVTAAEGDTFTWDFSLNQPAPEEGLTLFLPVTDNNDPAPGDVEYNIDGSENIADFEFVVEDDVSIGFNLTIAEGATEASLVSEAVADDVSEETEIFTTVIADGTDYRANPAQNEVTTTLLNLPTVSVFAEPTEVEEGSQLLWNFSLTEPVPEGGLTVALDLVEDTDPLPGDITYFVEGSENITDFELIINEESGLIDQALVTLAENATEATLVNDIIADNVTEGEESVSFALAESDEYAIDSEENAASFTILDTSTDLPTISVVAEPTEVEEGSQLLWNFELTEPVPEGGLAVALDLVEDTDPLPGDITYFVEGSENITDFELVINEESGLIEQALVTLDEGVTEATLVNDIIADNATEGEESVSFALAESDEYNIDSEVNSADFTILDTSTAPAFIQQDLYFGLSLGDGIEVSDTRFQTFVEEEITSRFPGATIFDAQGQVRGDDGNVLIESTKVVTLILEDSSENATAVEEVLANYQEQFEGAGILQVTDPDISTSINASSNNSSSVEIINPGFEEPVLEDGVFTLTSEDIEVPGWTLYNPDSLDVDLGVADAGAWNPPSEQYPNGTPGGENVGYTFVDSSLLGTGEIGLQQTTDEPITAGTEYTLAVDIANATGGDEFGDYSGFPGYRVELLAGEEVIAIDDNSLSIEEGSFGTATVSYTATEDDPFLNQNLGIRLINLNAASGLEVDFDNVSLSAI